MQIEVVEAEAEVEDGPPGALILGGMASLSCGCWPDKHQPGAQRQELTPGEVKTLVVEMEFPKPGSTATRGRRCLRACL